MSKDWMPPNNPRCSRCNDEGTIMAHSLDAPTSGPFIFLCTCLGSNPSVSEWKKKRRYPEWNIEARQRFVPAWEDVRPTKQWVFEQFKYEKTKEPEFKRRVEIWGRPWFKTLWEDYKAESPSTENFEEGLKEMPHVAGGEG